ncbi:MAG TPA: PilZ domain-containing protein [Candidatus Angelobacter sp.]|nr:PilZ domain-containing protein [Candidatus Angelobacter sp.]
MSSRSSLRRKIVLPVTVVRSKLGQSQLAHTVDLSDTSARLGGLTMLLEPGEVVGIQREGMTAKFQVFWMGSPGTAMEGQAGIRSLEPDKPIWGSGPKEDVDREDTTGSEIDVPVSLPEATAPLPGEKRWHARLECTGSAAVLSLGSQFPVRGQIKDVSQGGVYVEVTTPLAVKSKVSLEMNIEGISFEAKGVVRTSYPMVGMGISFVTLSTENEEKLARVLEKVTARLQGNQAVPVSSSAQVAKPAALRLDAYPIRVLVMACQALATDFEQWKGTHSPAEIAELRRAVHDLYQKLSLKSESGPQVELLDYMSTSKPRGGAA